MKKIEIKNMHIKILSVLVAVSLWFYVGSAEDPLTENKTDVAIVYENLNGDYVLLDKVENVNVVLRGRESQMNEFDKNDIKVIVDLKEAQVGQNSFEIDVENRSGMDIIGVSPNVVDLMVDELKTISLKVEPQINGTVAEGYLLNGVTAIPNSISVSGPSSYLSQLRAAKAQLDIENVTASVKGVASVSLLNHANEVISHESLKILTPTVELEVDVLEKDPTKVVPIRSNIIGEVAEGFVLEGTTCAPSSIRISGKEEVLQRVSIIYTDEIDVSGLSETTQKGVSLKIPSGITIENGTKNSKVTLHITKESKKETVNVPIKIVGQANGLVTLSQSNAEVVLKGTDEAILRAKETLEVSVDISNLTVGTHTVEMDASLAGDAVIETITPKEITVTIANTLFN